MLKARWYGLIPEYPAVELPLITDHYRVVTKTHGIIFTLEEVFIPFCSGRLTYSLHRQPTMASNFIKHLNGDHGHDREHTWMDATISSPHAAMMPIAVVGLAGRFPGDATTPQALWEMCCHGESVWSKVPKDQINAKAYFQSNPSKSGCVSSWIDSDFPAMLADVEDSSTLQGPTF